MNARETLAEIGEFGLIERIGNIVGRDRATVGIGDDAAVLESGSQTCLLATVDMLVEGVHFRLADIDARDLGRRALAVNLSDIAAMGGRPRYALTSIALRPNLAVRLLEEIYQGIREEAERFGVVVVGGNVTRTGGPLALDVTLLGEAARDTVVLRSGAKQGDLLVVTGTLGDAAAARLARDRDLGLSHPEIKHLLERQRVPEPRLEAGAALASRHLADAMIDLSDGLGSDVHHLAGASGMGAVIYEDRVPISIGARHVASMAGFDALELALYGGEDYELLVALPEDALQAAQEAVSGPSLYTVGTVLGPDDDVLLQRAGAERRPLKPSGWTHF